MMEIYLERSKRDSDMFELYYVNKYKRTVLLAILYVDHVADIMGREWDEIRDNNKMQIKPIEILSTQIVT